MLLYDTLITSGTSVVTSAIRIGELGTSVVDTGVRGLGGVSCLGRGREGDIPPTVEVKEGAVGTAYASNLRGPVGEANRREYKGHLILVMRSNRSKYNMYRSKYKVYRLKYNTYRSIGPTCTVLSNSRGSLCLVGVRRWVGL